MPPNKRICWLRHNICNTLHTFNAHAPSRELFACCWACLKEAIAGPKSEGCILSPTPRFFTV